jgi:hypothetical protein
MVYSSPIPEYEDIPFSIASPTPPDPSVQVKFNGTGLHKIAGPVPFINLSKTYNRNNAGNVENIQTTVRIQGQIVRASGNIGLTPPGTGTTAILGAIKELQQLFNCSNGLFEVNCGGTGISVSGARVNTFSANRSNDNWIFSAEYEVELEYNEPGLTGYPPVKNTVDTWNIEPLEDYTYSNFTINNSGKAEYSNPRIKPSITALGARDPVGNNSITLSVVNIPQFKVSRRLSAVGFPISNSGTGCPAPSGDSTAYFAAKKWVEMKLAESFMINGPSGSVSLVNSNSPTLANFDKVFLFNHLRTINFSSSEGSYEVNDTWLAMPTGVRYVEDYTLESSTDDRYIKTVRVQGNIKGLSFAAIPIMSGGSGLPPSGQWPPVNGASNKLDLTYSLSSGQGSLASSTKILDSFNEISHDSTNFFANKYNNALSGWINDIKPYLYRRASIVLNNGGDRSDTYVSPALSPPKAPKNPIYCRENLLNTIPISTSEGHDPRKGTISYSYEYSNRFVFISGAISENVTINDTGPVDVVNETFVLGRRLGPILQSLGTRTAARKDVTIEVAVLPPSSLAGFNMTNQECPLWTGGTVYSTITGMIEGLKPYGDRTVTIFGNMGTNETRTGGPLNNQGQVFLNQDNYTWNPVEGRYTRTIGWTYQACNTARSPLDN